MIVMRFACGAMVLGLPGCLGTSAVNPDGPILETVRDYYADFSAQDWDGLEQLFWPQADIITIWRLPAEERADVIATPIEALKRGAPVRAGHQFEEWLVDADVRTLGNLAQVWVRHGARHVAGDGNEREWSGVDAFTLIAHEGQWKISSLAFEGGNDTWEER